MSLTPEWRASLHQPQAAVAARTLPASTHACDQRLQDYANDLCRWRQQHESAIEQLVRVNRAAVEALTREERRVHEARQRLHREAKGAAGLEELREGVEGLEVRHGDQEQVWEPPAAAAVACRFQVPRDTALAIASSKVRRANKLATEAISREHTDVFATLFAPDCSHWKPCSSLSSPTPLHGSLRPPADGRSAELKAAQLLSMEAAVREAVVAGSVFAVQTRNLDLETEALRCGRLTLSRGHLHLHCLAEGAPPPGSITIEEDG